MFGFADPVSVDLVQRGTTLGGQGCCGPIGPSNIVDCCGSISGEREEDELSFAFPAGSLGYLYMADVVVAEDGSRMGGIFRSDTGAEEPGRGVKGAWLRYSPESETGWLPTNEEIVAAVSNLEVTLMQLTEDSEEGDGFERGESYTMVPNYGAIVGDLGPFWSTEMRLEDGDDGVIVAGPVPVTHPSLPESLVIRPDDGRVLEVELTMPSGASYRFEPTPTEDP